VHTNDILAEIVELRQRVEQLQAEVASGDRAIIHLMKLIDWAEYFFGPVQNWPLPRHPTRVPPGAVLH
jgi:hypothetical protein